EFMVRASDKHDTENVKKALMIINPDAYYWGLINDEDALKEIFKRSNIRMAGNVCNQMKKEALFRPKPSPEGNDSNLLIVFYVQIMPDDFVMQLHRF
ncbi:hypothetical protein, partial [Bacteroides uniformis]|uniref:hypothetical protein n=1 Tax=Bacteroides uniformis TaxID=820 RepID=UPI00195A53EE